MVKQVFNDEGVVYNYLKILRKTEPRVNKNGDRETRVEVECQLCGTIKDMAWHKVKSGRNKTCGCTSFKRQRNLTGQKVGMLTAVKSTGKKKRGSIIWDFICDCGGEKQMTVSQFSSGSIGSCGCQQYKGTPLDLAGDRFGRLIAIKPVDKNKAGQYIWQCMCDCGNEHIVTGSALVQGVTKSCGCYAKDVAGQVSVTHGMSSTPEYGAWKNAITRCSDPENKKYVDYGGRGIRVCERWQWPAEIGFKNFMEDMGRCEGLTLDRIDPNGDYCPENCRWVDRYIQGYNTRQHSTNTSGKTGVSKNKDGTWQSYINFKGKRYPLGEYNSFEEAVEAREQAEIKFYGEKKGH